VDFQIKKASGVEARKAGNDSAQTRSISVNNSSQDREERYPRASDLSKARRYQKERGENRSKFSPREEEGQKTSVCPFKGVYG